MLFQFFPDTGEPDGYCMATDAEKLRQFLYGVTVPITADEKHPVMLVHLLQKSIEAGGYAPCFQFIIQAIGAGDVSLQLLQRDSIGTVSFLCGVCVIACDGNIADDGT